VPTDPRFDALDVARPHLRELQPYTSARDEFTGSAHVFLDANENPYGSVAGGALNRYPDPHSRAVKARLGDVLGVAPDGLFIGNGSDEAIDLLVHAFCEPGVDHIVTTPPTYGMYAVTAAVNNVAVREVLLTPHHMLDAKAVVTALDAHSKLVFLCSPNNPTGNLQPLEAMIEVAAASPGLVVIDEAYIDFAPGGSALGILDEHPNVVVLRTFSKAWGMAAARIGVAIGHPSVAALLERIKLPYNLSELAQRVVLEALAHTERRDEFVAAIIRERDWLTERLADLDGVEHVYPSDANFLLARFIRARGTYEALVQRGVIVRDRSRVVLCEGGLRITVGTRPENETLLAALRAIDSAR
jgi:histidinol-phosphate aminotransferase